MGAIIPNWVSRGLTRSTTKRGAADGRRPAIDQVNRTTAPMHDGVAGGAFLDTAGGLIGIATAAAIRGLGVVIPASIAWRTAATVLERRALPVWAVPVLSAQFSVLAFHPGPLTTRPGF